MQHPPLLGTTRASFPARGSRLEHPIMSPCPLAFIISYEAQSSTVTSGSLIKIFWISRKIRSEYHLTWIYGIIPFHFHVLWSVQWIPSSLNIPIGKVVSDCFFRQDLLWKSALFPVRSKDPIRSITDRLSLFPASSASYSVPLPHVRDTSGSFAGKYEVYQVPYNWLSSVSLGRYFPPIAQRMTKG